ncbi:helix-turn-helix domain-containing protein [Pseudodesulfovibrio sp. zrk46]|nr:helix-turn-helix domain-containing protein [Pseudodesulfovibrio sp. zrk46]
MSKPPTLFTVREVADILRVHQRTAYRLITGGSIKAIKIGSQWRVPEASLMDFLNSGWQEPESEGKKESGPTQYKLPLE